MNPSPIRKMNSLRPFLIILCAIGAFASDGYAGSAYPIYVSASASEKSRPLPLTGVRLGDFMASKTHTMNLNLGHRGWARIVTPCGQIVREELVKTFQAKGIQGAGTHSDAHRAFDAVAYLNDESVSVVGSEGRIDVQIRFSVILKRPSGEALSTQTITGSSAVADTYFPGIPALQQRYESAIRLAAGNLAQQICSELLNVERMSQFLGGDRATFVAGGSDALTGEGARQFAARDYRRAYWYFDQAVKSSPNHQAALAYHGAALVKLGYPAAGRYQLRQAALVDFGTAEAEQARKWLLAFR